MARGTDTESINAPTIKRNIKDSVFTNLFADKRNLVRLYRALHPEDKETEEKDIENVTLNNIFTDKRYNDLGFRVGDRVLVLLEAQSTWTVNIVLRIMMYLMQTYNDYCTENGIDLYGSKKASLPKPELYVIFTGERKNHPEVLSLKDEFWGGDAEVDARVRVIYDGQPGDIINQYVAFTRVANDQIKKYGRTQKAAQETIRICVNEDVLADYLKEKEVEVMDIMTALFDEEEVTRRFLASKEREIAEEKAEEIARQLLNKGKMSVEDIADCTGLSVQEVEKIANLELV